MAICRNINPFTFARDKKELEQLIVSYKEVLKAVQNAKDLRNKIRLAEHQEHGDENYQKYIEMERKNFQEAKETVAASLSEYRARSMFAHMNIAKAIKHLAAMEEYVESYL